MILSKITNNIIASSLLSTLSGDLSVMVKEKMEAINGFTKKKNWWRSNMKDIF
jgi:hypothetical protein